jgi:hypothetical protein
MRVVQDYRPRRPRVEKYDMLRASHERDVRVHGRNGRLPISVHESSQLDRAARI